MSLALIALAASLAADAGASADAPPHVATLLSEPVVARLTQDPAAAPEKKEPEWTGSVTVGAIATTGNSETRTANATADAVLDRGKDRFTLGFLWVYADEKNTTSDWTLTDRKTSGRGKYDYFLTEKTYAWGALSAENDELSDLKLRLTVAAGLGRQFVDTERWKFAGEAGLSYVDEDYDQSEDADYVGARLALNTSHEHDERWSFAHTLEAFPSLEDQDDVYGRSDLRIKLTFTESMLAQLQWVADYDNTPASGKERLDHRYILSVGWKF
jgi:putative salt-induced outer membrane protein